MIESFRHRGLQRLYEHDDSRRLPPDKIDRIQQILGLLDAAQSPEDLKLPSLRLHQLTGDRKGFYAVTVRANWRIVFRFTDGNAEDVDLADYH